MTDFSGPVRKAKSKMTRDDSKSTITGSSGFPKLPSVDRRSAGKGSQKPLPMIDHSK